MVADMGTAIVDTGVIPDAGFVGPADDAQPALDAAPAPDATTFADASAFSDAMMSIDSGDSCGGFCIAGQNVCTFDPTNNRFICVTIVVPSDAGFPPDAAPAPDATVFPDAATAFPDALVLPDADFDAGFSSVADAFVPDALPAPDAVTFLDATSALPDATVLPDTGFADALVLDAAPAPDAMVFPDASEPADTGPLDIGSASSDAGLAGTSSITHALSSTGAHQLPPSTTMINIWVECKRGGNTTYPWRVYGSVAVSPTTSVTTSVSVVVAYVRGDYCKVNAQAVDASGTSLLWDPGDLIADRHVIGQWNAAGAVSVTQVDNPPTTGGSAMIIQY